MSDSQERPTVAVSVPMQSGAGMSPAVGVAAPVGAVRRKDRERAARTSLQRDGAALVLHAELPGTVSLQRRGPDGGWETLDTRQVGRTGDTAMAIPQDGGSESPAALRVVFAPRNANLTAWISETVQA